ncbi:MAG: selenocysteine-specific translation elongation factor [Deltaproteobacteria bacterium]
MSDPHVIVGTAGHIDHGKTTLIQALTGVDTDRLPEEKKRGITIVLGFAPLTLADGRRVGVIDVPGHERFVKNMVAGAGGIDVVLLVVAADEGVMPQTREHLEICQLLGVKRGVVALTKIDRAGELYELAIDDVKTEVEGTFLEDAPIVPCSATTGEGIDAVKAALTEAVSSVVDTDRSGPMLLPVDRVFSMKGFGSVITGTLLRGALAVGDTVDVLPPIPGHTIDKGARVRGIQVFGAAEERAFGGQRTAVNLQGVDLEQLRIGQNLVSRGAAVPTKKLTVRLTYLRSRKKKLKTGAKILLHTGTSLVEAGITLFAQDALEPGSTGYATLRLAEPIATLPGMRFIARGFEAVRSAGRTIAGGVVLDPNPARRRRKAPESIALVQALNALVEKGPKDERLVNALDGLVKERGPAGAELSDLSRRLGHSTKVCEKAAKGTIARVQDRLVSGEAVDELATRIEAVCAAYHKEFPFRSGVSVAELSTRLGRTIPTSIVDHTVRQMMKSKRLAEDREGVRLPSHRAAVDLGGAAQEKVLDTLAAAGLEPPAPSALGAAASLDAAQTKELLAALTRTKKIVHAGGGLYFAASVYEDATQKVLAHIAAEDGITTAQAKALLGISRKYLIPFLESLDKRGVTARIGEVRKARR